MCMWARRRRVLTIIVGAGCACFLVGPLAAFRVVVAREGPANTPDSPYAALLQPSEEATHLLSRADEAIKREDWKLAIDSLQRIVELAGDHVLSSDERRYESARRYAHRRIASLPAPGMRAYRLMYDGEASALMSQAVEQHDPAMLRTIIGRFLVTGVGDDAAVTLAGWLIDEGRFSEAAAVLQDVRMFYPDSDLPPWVVPGRLAVCAAGMGQRRRAETILSQLAATRPAGTDSDLPTADRVRQIRAFIDRFGPDADRRRATHWPMTGGCPSRDGEMHVVEPALVEHLPWRFDLPISEPREGFGAVQSYALERKLVPFRRIVTDGRTLVVKGERELVGLDVDGFLPVWRKSKPSGPVVSLDTSGPAYRPVRADQARTDDPLSANPVVRRLLYDSVGSGVVIAFDMALTVEWVGEPPGMSRIAVRVRGRRPMAVGLGNWPAAHASGSNRNRVIAYSLDDGSELWTSEVGGPLDPDAEEGSNDDVEFLAVPIPVNDHLVAPCRMNNDLYAVVLDPRTGKQVRRIYLCGTSSGGFDSARALEPALADGVVFIPSGKGLLFAVEVSSWSIRWAVRYESNGGGSAGWLPTPVVAVADVVLLAPGDAEYLFCFDRGTGETRWQVDRDNFTYVLGATDAHVWLAGEDLQQVGVESGKPLWRFPCGQPTGRGVISGERIYLPTTEGVVAMNAITGDTINVDSSPDSMPLGNLLAWDGSLYSVDLTGVRKFPDLTRGYAEAVARHAENPTDASRAIRLAWLELLRHQPAEALAALARVPEVLANEDSRRYGQVIRLRVRAMLERVASGDLPSEEALELLRKARKIARTAEDAIETSVALGDFHRNEGRPLEACRQYLSLILWEQGDEMIGKTSGFERRARSLAAQKIADAAGKLSETDTRKLAAEIREWLDEAVSGRDESRLLRLVGNVPVGDVAGEAELHLGIWAAEELGFEHAEAYFADTLRRPTSPRLLAEATARLAAIYLEPAAELHQPVSAVALIERLEREFPTIELSPEVIEPEPEPRRPGEADRPLVPAAELAAVLRDRIDGEILEMHQAAMTPFSLGKPGEPTASSHEDARPLAVRGERVEALANQIMLLVSGNEVETRRPDGGRELWKAGLRLLGEPAVDVGSSTGSDPAIMWQQMEGHSNERGPSRVARAVVDGQTMVVNSAYGLHAIGLLTGRRLWSRPFDPPNLINQDPTGSDAWIWAHRGYLISISTHGQMEVSRITHGDRILWRRRMPQRRWYAVRARGDYVVAVDQTLEQVDVFRLSDGRYLGECRFKQDESPSRKVNIALYDDVICGPASDHDLVAMELATPGAERWRISTPDRLSQVFKPTPKLLGIADASGHVKVIDPSTQRSLMDVTVYACEEGVVDGSLVDDVLYVCGYAARAKRGVPYDWQRWALAAVAMEDNRILWQRSDIGARAYLNGELLRVSSDAIPVVVFRPSAKQSGRAVSSEITLSGGNDGKQTVGLVELMIIDKATGKMVGQAVVTPVPSGVGANRILDVQAWPGKVLVTAGSRTLRFPVGDRGRDGAGAGAPPEDHPGFAAEVGGRGGLRPDPWRDVLNEINGVGDD